MPNQKGFSKIIIIIIALVFMGVIYFVFSGKKENFLFKNNEKQDQLKQSIDGILYIDNWKTYIHEKTDDYSFLKKFSIKYPPNAKIEAGNEERGNFPYITISFQENGFNCLMISPPFPIGDEGFDGNTTSNKVTIGSNVWEETIRKDSDGFIVFYALSSDEIPISFDLTPTNEKRGNECLSMYKKILATIKTI